jgi:hypothetical protein
MSQRRPLRAMGGRQMITHLYTAEDGLSHVEDITLALTPALSQREKEHGHMSKPQQAT